jgi:uncharacterized repeat protein (TIGR02543 family)
MKVNSTYGSVRCSEKLSPRYPLTTLPIRRVAALLLLAAFLGSLSTVAGISTNQPLPAHAAAGDGITAYVSPPFVQGPPNTYSATIETFNSGSFCSALGPVAVGTFSGSCTDSDGVSSVWGGATTTSDSPTVGGTPSRFLVAPTPSNLTLTFTTPMKYFGFWWSAGSAGNTVKIYTSTSGASPAATFTTTTINSILGGTIPSPYPGSATVRALGGTSYNKGYYFGRPAHHTSLTPTAYTRDNNESHAYLNIFASGSIEFTKIEFTGSGFEFDNVAISSTTQTPTQNLVFIESVLGKTVTFMANSGDGTMAAQTDSAAANLTANSYSRPGYTFAGWHTTISGTGGTSFGNLASYDFAADLTLYAQWTADPLTITYNAQGGSAISNGNTTTGASISASPGTPEQSGYTFNGWFAASSGGTAITFPYAHNQTANFTLYAQWSIDPSAPTTTATPAPAAPAPVPAATTTAEPTTTTSSTTTIAELVPSISAPRQILTGTSITVIARGFVPGESVVMSVGKNGKTRIVTADINGEVRLNVKLTAVGDGERVTASAVAGSRKASQVIEIKEEPATLPKTGFSPMPTLLLSALFSLAGLLILARRRFMHLLR